MINNWKAQSEQRDEGQANKGRVLVVDNGEERLIALEELFRGAGYSTVAMWSGLEALALLQSERFNVLLVDDYLPDLYIGEFLNRLSVLSVPPSVIILHDGRPRVDVRTLDPMVACSIVDKKETSKILEAVGAGCEVH